MKHRRTAFLDGNALSQALLRQHGQGSQQGASS